MKGFQIITKQPKSNGIIHLSDAVSFFIGISMCSFAVIIPSYVKSYTDNKWLLALVPLIMDIGWTLPQIFSVYLEHRKKERTPIKTYFIFEIIHRISYIAIGVSILLFADNKAIALLSFYILYLASSISWGLAVPHWTDTLSVTIDDKYRADFLGKRDFVARWFGIAASFAVPLILGSSKFPTNYGYLFIVAGLFFTLGAIPIRFLHSVFPFKKKKQVQVHGFFSFAKRGIKRLFANKKLRGFLLLFWGGAVSRITSAYFTPYIIDRIIVNYPAESRTLLIGMLNTSLLIFFAIASIIVGWVIHRFKHKVAFIISLIALVLSNLLVLVFPIYPIAIVSNFFLAYFLLSSFMVPVNTIMDYTPHSVRSLRLASFNLINSISFFIFTFVIGSWLATYFDYEGAMWFVCIFAGLLLVGSFFVREQGKKGKIGNELKSS